MKRVDVIDDLFKNGFSCAQAVLMGYGESFGLDREESLKTTRAFGSGMGLGWTCGAVSGAFMILGHSVENAESERDARYKTYDLVAEFVRRFKERHGSVVCKDLLSGVDLGTEEGRQEARDRNLFTTICPAYVRSAGEILSEMLGEKE